MTNPATRYRPTGPVVVKIGGRALDSATALGELATEVKTLCRMGVLAARNEDGRASGTADPRSGLNTDNEPGRGVLLIHGGGAEVTDWCTRLGIEPRFHQGLRISDPPTLAVVVAVLAGLANKRLVAGLLAADVDAVGLAGLDGGTVTCVPHPEAATLGAVGAVESVAPALLETLLERGAVPVLASIGSYQGGLLNLNADDLAAAVAPAVRAGTLVLLSDTPGLKLDGVVVRSLDHEGLAAAMNHPDVQGGMLPKLRATRAALESGVRRVVLAAWQGPETVSRLLAGEAVGTTFTRASAKEIMNG